jgi:hypothetical protein
MKFKALRGELWEPIDALMTIIHKAYVHMGESIGYSAG